MDNQSNNDDIPFPTFSGNHMPLNVSLVDDDDIGEETTRRVGGFTPMAQPAVFDFTAPPSLAPPSFATVQTVLTKTAPARAPQHGWTLNEAPTLPEFHPLERTAVFCPHSNSSTISQRVSNVLSELSIQAEFKGNEADCLTQDNVEFSVFLYRGKKQYSHGIIVEVQRIYGNSMNFINDTRTILDAAECSVEPPKKKLKKTATIPLVEDDDDDDFEVSSSSLAFVRTMFKNNVKLLALETLSSMTDANKMGAKTARATSQQLLSSDLAGMILEILLQGNDEKSEVTMQAMIVLSNVAQEAALPMKQVKPILLSKLRGKNTQLAYLAAKCIKEVDTELADALYKAKQLKGHSALAKLASSLLEEGGI